MFVYLINSDAGVPFCDSLFSTTYTIALTFGTKIRLATVGPKRDMHDKQPKIVKA